MTVRELVVKRFIPTCVGNTARARPGWRSGSVHPHVRGEYFTRFQRQLKRLGSSPRAWGIHAIAITAVVEVRFIPTCVGNTERPMRAPRSESGSSPRAWGIQAVVVPEDLSGRFIPTCVGNTLCSQSSRWPHPVHPHVRGEYEPSYVVKDKDGGSSPRAWGIPRYLIPKRLHDRFIPTCVGNTRGAATPPHVDSVHPHVRGEYLGVSGVGNGLIGSSPRAWGIRPRNPPLRAPLRFIPTCVGNTIAPNRPPMIVTVHPHVRGEYTLSRISLIVALRFIPTCVGNTPCLGQRSPVLAVHPHVRGEYLTQFQNPYRLNGSSPRAWGILSAVCPQDASNRFIPTCVGNTRAPARRA